MAKLGATYASTESAFWCATPKRRHALNFRKACVFLEKSSKITSRASKTLEKSSKAPKIAWISVGGGRGSFWKVVIAELLGRPRVRQIVARPVLQKGGNRQ